MKIQFEIPRVHPSLNLWVTKWHWSKRQKEQETWDILVKNEWRKLNKIKFKGIVQVSIIYYMKANRIRDYDNYTPKFIMDALKDAFIADDNMRIIKAPVWDIIKDEKERTIITIEGNDE